MKRTQKVIYALGLAFVASAIWGRCLVTTATACHATTGHASPCPLPPLFPFLLHPELWCQQNKKREQRKSSGLFSNSFGLREALKRPAGKGIPTGYRAWPGEASPASGKLSQHCNN